MNINQAAWQRVTQISKQISSEIRRKKGFVNTNDAAYEASEQQRAETLSVLIDDEALLSESLYSVIEAFHVMMKCLLADEAYKYLNYMIERLDDGECKALHISILSFRQEFIHCPDSKLAIDESLRLSPATQMSINE